MSDELRSTRRLRPVLAGITGLASVVVASAVPTLAARPALAAPSDWPVYHQDSLGSGVDPSGTSLTSATAAWTSVPFDGQIYGEPLVEAGLVIAATENNTVYALAANTGTVVWQTHIATSVPSGDLPCGNISPTVGITSTPVIDPTLGEIFVVDDESTAGNGASHHLVGINLSTGAILLDQAVDPPGSHPLYQLQRPGLTLDNGQVIIGFGGNSGDCETGSNPYHGWLVAVPETGGSMRTFEVASQSGDSEGAIWMGGAAPVVDGSGNIWVATGNSAFGSSTDPYDNSDGVLELSPSLALKQGFAPSGWYSDNASDRDLGSSAPALVAGGLVFQAGKSQTGYLLSQAVLGGVGGQLVTANSYCGSDVDGGSAVLGSIVYAPCLSGVVATQTSGSPASISVLWKTSTGSGGPPIVAGGLVWTMDYHNGFLYGLDPTTGKPVQSFSLGSIANHFPTPSVADGLLLAASTDQVHAFSSGSPFSVTTSSLPVGSVQALYPATLSAAGGMTPYRWTLSSGALPPGLRLSSKGVIWGKPKASGTSTFTVKVADHKTVTHAQETATQALSITVTQPTPTITKVGPNSGPITGGTRVTITGTSLWAPSLVMFGGYPATGVTVNAAGTKITAYSPAEGAGTVDIVVTTPGGFTTPGSSDKFTYP